MDIYNEITIPRKLARDPQKTVRRLRTACWVMTFLGIMVSFWLLIATAILWIVYFIAKRLLAFDFEYIHINDSFDIDIVMGGISRRNMLSLSLSQVVLIAPWDSEELEPYEHIKAVDYSARDPYNKPYVMICVVKDQRKKVCLQLDQKMLRGLKQMIPQKVIMGI